MKAGKAGTTSSLGSDLLDAALMARVTVEFLGRALEFDDTKEHKLSASEGDLLAFLVMRTCLYIEAAQERYADGER